MSENAVARIVADLPSLQPKGMDGGRDLLRRWTMAELLAEPDEFRWLVKGMLVDPTYGQIAGELKTLKSVIATFVTVAVAAGEPLFGHFDVGMARPVVAYVGEGGRKPYKRRLRRIAHAMGVKLDDLPLPAPEWDFRTTKLPNGRYGVGVIFKRLDRDGRAPEKAGIS